MRFSTNEGDAPITSIAAAEGWRAVFFKSVEPYHYFRPVAVWASTSDGVVGLCPSESLAGLASAHDIGGFHCYHYGDIPAIPLLKREEWADIGKAWADAMRARFDGDDCPPPIDLSFIK